MDMVQGLLCASRPLGVRHRSHNRMLKDDSATTSTFQVHAQDDDEDDGFDADFDVVPTLADWHSPGCGGAAAAAAAASPHMGDLQPCAPGAGVQWLKKVQGMVMRCNTAASTQATCADRPGADAWFCRC